MTISHPSKEIPAVTQLQQFIRLATDRENPREDDDLAITASNITWTGAWPPPQDVYLVWPYNAGTPLIFDDENMSKLKEQVEEHGHTLEDLYVIFHYEQVSCSKFTDDMVQPGAFLSRGAEYHFRGLRPWTAPITDTTEEPASA